MATNRIQPSARVIVATQTLSAIASTSDGLDGHPLSDLVGTRIHLYGIETFDSTAYGMGVRLHYRLADDYGSEIGDDAVAYTFAYRVRQLAVNVLDGKPYVAITPPASARVVSFPTAKGSSIQLVDA